jgi:outer membrane biogenesis lipoprotein LolB
MMRGMRTIPALLAGLLLVGCSSTTTPAAAPSPAATFANPVSYITRAGCVPDAATVNGQLGLDGTFMTASCTFDSLTQITVNTFKTAADEQRDVDRNGQYPQDGRARIVGDGWDAYLTAAAGQSPDPTAQSIQSILGGTVK